MAWYSELGRVVLHGGSGFKDSWSWDGSTWHFGDDKFYPFDLPPIDQPAMAGTIDGPILYGAAGDSQGGDTFKGDAGLRFVVVSVNFPTAIDAVHLASNGVDVIMFGGFNGFPTPIDETWVTSTSSTGWAQNQTSPRPGPRVEGGFAFHSSQSNYVLFGGLGPGGLLLSDTWTYAGSAWTARTLPARSPSAFSETTCEYDAAHGRVILWSGDTQLSWQWTPRREWEQLSIPPADIVGPGQASAYDSKRRVVVILGRDITNGDKMETWELGEGDPIGAEAGGEWNEVLTSTTPSTRVYHGMAYDAARAQVVMFGSHAAGSTWTYDGSNWTEHTVVGPPPRAYPRLAYDARRERVVLFGGSGMPSGLLLADTWEWDGTSWTERTPAMSPAGRIRHSLTYDPARERVILVGGETVTGYASDTWDWNGTTWTRTVLAAPAPVRAYHCAAYDAVGRQLLIFGGQNFFNSPVAETWALRFGDPARPGERCRFATDDFDADGLAGCADPDCWGRCTPGCIPGLACPTTAERCGDGACNRSVEDMYLCPDDC
jgi:hypothetical protein